MFGRAKRFFRGEPKTEAELLRIIRFEMGALQQPRADGTTILSEIYATSKDLDERSNRIRAKLQPALARHLDGNHGYTVKAAVIALPNQVAVGVGFILGDTVVPTIGEAFALEFAPEPADLLAGPAIRAVLERAGKQLKR